MTNECQSCITTASPMKQLLSSHVSIHNQVYLTLLGYIGCKIELTAIYYYSYLRQQIDLV